MRFVAHFERQSNKKACAFVSSLSFTLPRFSLNTIGNFCTFKRRKGGGEGKETMVPPLRCSASFSPSWTPYHKKPSSVVVNRPFSPIWLNNDHRLVYRIAQHSKQHPKSHSHVPKPNNRPSLTLLLCPARQHVLHFLSRCQFLLESHANNSTTVHKSKQSGHE